MSLPKVSNKLKAVGSNKQEDHRKRLLQNELSDIQAVKDRQAKYMLRDQAEIRKELWRMTEAKRKKQHTLRKQALETAVKQAQEASVSVLNKVRNQLRDKYSNLSITSQSSSQQQQPPTVITTEPTTQSQQLPRLSISKPPGLRSASLGSTASMISLLSSQAISRKRNDQFPESSSQRLPKQENPDDSDENNNQPTPTSQLQNDDRQSIHELKHETQEKVKSYLSEQGIVVDGNPLINSKVKRITEEVINMRNLGKSTDQIWTDVRSCRYLRRYEPPIMLIPTNTTQFVFPNCDSMDAYKRHIINMSNTVEQAAKIQRQVRDKHV